MQSANAQSSPSTFGANVSNSCTLVSVSDGLMVASTNRRRLSSGVPGGVSAVVTANTSSGGFSVTTIPPLFFTSSPGFQLAFFQSSYQVSGATSTGVVAGSTQTQLNAGSNRLDVDLQADKIFGGPFASGNYEAIVTVRCE
jgi:hypothetical protein